MGISLISLEKRAKRYIFCAKRAFAHFGLLNHIMALDFNQLSIVFKCSHHIVANFLCTFFCC